MEYHLGAQPCPVAFWSRNHMALNPNHCAINAIWAPGRSMDPHPTITGAMPRKYRDMPFWPPKLANCEGSLVLLQQNVKER